MALQVGSNTLHRKQPPGDGQDPVAEAAASAWPPGKNRRRWPWWLGAAALHAGLLALAWQARPWQDRGTPPATVVVPLQWLMVPGTHGQRWAPPPPSQPLAAAPALAPDSTTAPPPKRNADSKAVETTAISAAALPEAQPPETSRLAEPAFTAASTAASAAQPLNLDLPNRPGGQPPKTPSLLSEMLNDPRANTPKATVESRIAAALGDGRWQVEDLGEGAKRYRRGAECYVVKPARSGLLNPFNASMYTPPPLVGSC